MTRPRVRAALLAMLWLPALAAAQTFPVKPIRIIAAATAGGGVDTSSRILAQHMAEVPGEPRIV